jgi:hypothetical protein
MQKPGDPKIKEVAVGKNPRELEGRIVQGTKKAVNAEYAGIRDLADSAGRPPRPVSRLHGLVTMGPEGELGPFVSARSSKMNCK